MAGDGSQGCHLRGLNGDVTAGEGASGAERGPERSALDRRLDLPHGVFSLFLSPPPLFYCSELRNLNPCEKNLTSEQT